MGNFLFRMDLDVNHSDMFGTTALMYASKQQPGETVVKLLLERKDLDLDGKDGDGKTAEDYATALSNTAVVKLIREERSRRMGRVWSHLEEDSEEDGEEEVGEDAKEEVEGDVEEKDIHAEEREENKEEEEDDFLQRQLRQNLRDRLSQEMCLEERREEQYQAELSKIKTEKETSERVLKEKLQELESKFLTSKKLLDESYMKDKSKSQSMIARLEKAIANINLTKILNAGTTCSELECPICLEATVNILLKILIVPISFMFPCWQGARGEYWFSKHFL